MDTGESIQFRTLNQFSPFLRRIRNFNVLLSVDDPSRSNRVRLQLTEIGHCIVRYHDQAGSTGCVNEQQSCNQNFTDTPCDRDP